MKFKIMLASLAAVAATLVVAPAIADDVPTDDPNCVDVTQGQVTDWTTGPAPGPEWQLSQTRERIVEEAYDETVKGFPEQWWNWSPNNTNEPFVGPPAFPSDPRGTWNGGHTNGGPKPGTFGTFQNGNGHGSWFHREPATPDKVIHHDAVVVTEYTYLLKTTKTYCVDPPVDECLGGGCEHNEPEPGSDPPFGDTSSTKETKCKPKKCVVIVKDSSGKVVDKSETVYGNVNEEGF